MLTRNYQECQTIGLQHLQKNALLRNYHELLVLQHLERITQTRNHRACLIASLQRLEKSVQPRNHHAHLPQCL
ncbi:hypothetical protein SCLCIDRAFT_21980 [Scleroderma citrinum Foug A]|uniref:Uncharacterized protein n=1 Tax=Scleroderma citrinum Foug A TaxID=1036808 RepID=A0A0C3EF44_9AGAM|nr:hypothetical protein SCLCIDRAFT_21980 [Scleroderma citrinum Foug A]